MEESVKMSDQEIIRGLIARDNRVTEEFFFVKCRPLLCSIIRKVFDYKVDYDELVNELYLYLMHDDAAKLKAFEYRSTVYQWLKVVATRFFISKRNQLIEKESQEPLYEGREDLQVEEADSCAREDLKRLFSLMPNKRYVYVIQQLVINGEDPEQVAEEMGVSTANLYNIKRRAMAHLTRVALNDIREYGR